MFGRRKLQKQIDELKKDVFRLENKPNNIGDTVWVHEIKGIIIGVELKENDKEDGFFSLRWNCFGDYYYIYKVFCDKTTHTIKSDTPLVLYNPKIHKSKRK